jgi:hypothetical protein
MNRLLKVILLSALLVGVPSASRADIIVPGANGSDGRINCGSFLTPPDPASYSCNPLIPCPTTTPFTLTIDLALAENKLWNVSPTVPGHGVYDKDKWATVFKYECVIIPSNVTVIFKNHPSRAPVVWLVSGAVDVKGTISLNAGGASGTLGIFAEPGPGGFRGGAYGPNSASLPSSGLGPGGGRRTGSSTSGCYSPASYATVGIRDANCGYPPTYGNTGILPLIGGSGGTPWDGGGGAGGGAILIACAKTITHGGAITARGSGGYSDMDGSGGAIRLVADRIVDSTTGAGSLSALGDNQGGYGRIRIEANVVQLAATSNPTYTLDAPGPTAVLWASDVGNAPSVRIVSVGGQTASTDPRASLDFPGTDVTVPNAGAQLVLIDAQYVPLDWSVDLRMVPKQGLEMRIPAAFGSGDATHSTWQATLPVGSGFSVLQVRAYEPTATATAGEAAEGIDTESSGVEEK